MSQLGAPPVPPPYAPPQLPQGKSYPEVPGWMVVVAALVAFALAGLLGLVVIQGRGHHAPLAPPPPAAKHHFPKHWNHKIAPLAKIAEKERGLSFKHPIAVRFLTPAAYVRTMRHQERDAGPMTAKDRRQVAHATGFLRALGLVSGTVDLRRAQSDTETADTLAYYSFRTKSITIRGRALTPQVRDTIVHELTHGLQDQNFHVGARMKALDKRSAPDSSEGEILDAVVEGDAVRIQDAYRASLPAKQRHALDAEAHRDSTRAHHGLTHTPGIVVSMFSAPYALGYGLVEAAAQADGNAGVDRLLRHTPTHELALLDPFRALSGDLGATHVALPAVPVGAKRFDRGELGALGWDWLLSERLALRQSLSVADGWGGDAYVAYDQGGRACTRIAYTGRTPVETDQMYSALRQWAAAAPGTPTRVSLHGSLVTLQSCDPGAGRHAGPDHSMAALHLAATRTGLGVGLMRIGLQQQVAACLAGKLVDTYPVADLDDPTYGEHDATFQAHVHQLELSCE